VPVLVTGATGLLGSHVVDLLVERRETVRVLIRPGERAPCLERADVEIARGDLGDPASLAAAVRGVDRVLHCAARTGPWGPRAEYETSNVRGLQALLNAALTASVRRFVHVSSITVHGNDVGGKVDESAPFRVEANPYSWSKVVGERWLERMIEKYRAPVTIVRPGWIYGPRDVASFARFARQIAKGRMMMVGSGHNHLPLVYVRDVAQGLLLASEASDALGRAYLLVNDEPVTQRAYLGAIAAELGVPPPTRRIPYRLLLAMGKVAETIGHLSRREHAPPITTYGVRLLGGENRFDITRARRELGFRPRVNLCVGVRQSVAWYHAQPDAANPGER
jgi:2-alkyl-3-oxoalkanoate reductase